MKLLNLYHLVGVCVLLLMALSFSLGFKECAITLGIGLVAVLVLGVLLVLDNLGNQLNYHEKRIAEISNNVESVKASVEIVGKIFNQEIVVRTMTLDEIREELGKIEEEFKKLKSESNQFS